MSLRQELKTLWNQFDPIGVYGPHSKWHEDEYELYVAETLRLLEEGADYKKLYEYVALVTTEHMEVEISNFNLTIFIKKIKNYYKKYF